MTLKIISLKEDCQQLEQTMIDEQNYADRKNADDSLCFPQTDFLLRSIYLEKDRESAFNRFFNSIDFNTTKNILSIFNITKEMRICEIGGGSGFLTWALHRAAYNIDLLEPNTFFNTGVGYLQSREDAKTIKIYTNIDEWHQSTDNYDCIITRNCMHHFQNIAHVAASINQKMKTGALWFCFREWFADNFNDLKEQLKVHPYSQKYDLYEWPYPAYHYVDALEMAGFKLMAVAPYRYANNCLSEYNEQEWSKSITVLTKCIDKLLEISPHKTVKYFWKEVKKNKFNNAKYRRYTRPQLMVFYKKESF